MARGLNSVYLVGTLTEKPALTYSSGSLAILKLQLAGSDRVIGDDGEMRDLAWYHRVSVLGKQAEYLEEQLDAGTPVFVDGRLNYRSWEDPNSGQKRNALGITANRAEVLTLGPRGSDATMVDARGQHRLKNAINQVTLIGNLTRDPDLRYTASGKAVARLGVAVNEQYRDRSGQQQESVHFVDIDVWAELAEACAELQKGAPVMVMGRFVTDSWTGQDGTQNFRDKVVGTHIEFLTRGPGSGGDRARSAAQSGPPSAQTRQQQANPNLDIDEEEFPPEEDLPF